MSGYIGPQPVPQATQTREAFTATSGQTTFNTGGYTAGYIDVFLNGVKLAAADYTATNGSDVVLATGAATGDILETVAYTAFTVADQTFTGNIVMSDGLTVDNDGATVLTVDRATSDGTIIDVQKDGTSVGSIGVSTAGVSDLNLNVISGDVGLRFRPNDDSIVPINGSGSFRDNAIDLGLSNARFKDLYLSGGVYLGGTGASNKLDDYEEGTWTLSVNSGVTLSSGSASSGRYTKVGNKVFVTCLITPDSVTSSNNFLDISGLPFTVDSDTYGSSPSGVMTQYITTAPVYAFAPNGLATIRFYSTDAGSWDRLRHSNITTSTDIYLALTYRTTA